MLRRITSIFFLAVIVASLGITVVKADDEKNAFQPDFFAGNDIIFYDPRCSGSNNASDNVGTLSAGSVKSIEEFVDKYGQMAFDTGKKYGIPYEAILAQGALESAYGNSGLTQKANNFFGIKAGGSWTGETINMQTGEESSGGGSYTVDAAFRKYPTPAAGWDGYGDFITNNSRYKAALQYPGDPQSYLTAIRAAGYATDSAYVAKNMALVNKITAYIASTNKWPPSSEVAKTNVPTGGNAAAGADNTSAGCTLAVGDGSGGTIAETAKKLAWPNRGQHPGTEEKSARDEYRSTMRAVNDYSTAAETPWTDCGVFTATVVRASGADPQYVGRGTSGQISYLKATTSKWDTFIPHDTSELHPGDVMIINGNSTGHTYIFVGKWEEAGSFNIAQASLGDHVPEAGNVFLSDSRGPYTAARLKSNAVTDQQKT
jgi:hypothetical protein